MATFKDYIRIARPDHWVKHIFIIPGIALACLLVNDQNPNLIRAIVLGFFSACLVASANYVLNEWLDAQFDIYHPIKKNRPAACGKLKASYVYWEYILLITAGLILAWLVGKLFFSTSVVLLMMGVIYNVKPLRAKDRVFVDVLTESVNNPLRLMLGWSMVSNSTIPPSSLFVFYWFGGAFLMGAKRLAEYRYISKQDKLEDLKKYRKSFEFYTENSLLVSSVLYGFVSAFFIAAFLIKYRNEYLFVFPVFAILFAYYLSMSLKDVSIAQTPEKLHKDKRLVSIVIGLVILLVVFTYVDVPLAQRIIGSGEQRINYWFW